MHEVDIKDLVLNENAYFYRKVAALSPTSIQRIFTQALNDKKAKRKYQTLIRTPLFNGQNAIGKFSLDIFQFNKKPSFFKEAGADWEVKYGFFLIFEYKDYIALLLKNVSGAKALDSYLENIDYSVLQRFLVKKSSRFEKIVSSSMNTAENAVQRKTSEAVDLKQITSQFGTSKQIMNSLRIDNGGDKSTVALNTSRVNSFRLNTDFEKVLFWMAEIINLLEIAEAALPQSNFLDGFAEQIDFAKVIDNLKPTFISIRYASFLDEIESGKIIKCFKMVAGKEENVDLQTEVINNISLFELTEENSKLYTCGDMEVKINKKSITFSYEPYKEIILDFGDEVQISLNQYLNSGSNFIVNFDKVEYVYSHRKIFRDSKLLGDIANFMNAFIPYTELKNVTSEKGSGYLATSTTFSANSLFHFIENTLAKNADCLICDDMGTEWGDYISIAQDEIIFYHAKYHTDGLSASNLQEVFGQTQKNFSFLELTDEMIDQRKNRWLGNYNTGKVNTQIKRIRKCPDVTRPIESITLAKNSASSNPNVRRKVYIVVNFISKSELEKSLYLLKQNKPFQNKGVITQILWLVSSILSSAYDQNTELRIICQP